MTLPYTLSDGTPAVSTAWVAGEVAGALFLLDSGRTSHAREMLSGTLRTLGAIDKALTPVESSPDASGGA